MKVRAFCFSLLKTRVPEGTLSGGRRLGIKRTPARVIDGQREPWERRGVYLVLFAQPAPP